MDCGECGAGGCMTVKKLIGRLPFRTISVVIAGLQRGRRYNDGIVMLSLHDTVATFNMKGLAQRKISVGVVGWNPFYGHLRNCTQGLR
jgi:hypothetical protein